MSPNSYELMMHPNLFSDAFSICSMYVRRAEGRRRGGGGGGDKESGHQSLFVLFGWLDGWFGFVCLLMQFFVSFLVFVFCCLFVFWKGGGVRGEGSNEKPNVKCTVVVRPIQEYVEI